MSGIDGRLRALEDRYEELGRWLAAPDAYEDHERVQRLSQEQARLRELVDPARAWRAARRAADDAEQMARHETDPELVALAEEEVRAQREEELRRFDALRLLLVPTDPNDDRDVVVEIRAGTGGDEAALFAGDLFRMYTLYAGRRHWALDVVESSISGRGLKEIVFEIRGQAAYSRLKFENGVHRVQRVPETETQGRIHTSAASVVVMPEADDVEVEVREEDLRIDVFRSTGHGGQSVNTTDSAVRITHLPSGIVVSCQDEKSQLKNKNKAMKVLKARLYDQAQKERNEELSATRRSAVGTGDRSEKVRTYNFPQMRITDHRVPGLTVYQLDKVMNGEIDLLIEPLMQDDQTRRLLAAQADGSDAV